MLSVKLEYAIIAVPPLLYIAPPSSAVLLLNVELNTVVRGPKYTPPAFDDAWLSVKPELVTLVFSPLIYTAPPQVALCLVNVEESIVAFIPATNTAPP